MKKTIFTIAVSCIILTSFSFAQKSSFGITAGATFASYKLKVSDVSFTAKTRTGFTAGLVSSFSVGKYFSFSAGTKFYTKRR